MNKKITAVAAVTALVLSFQCVAYSAAGVNSAVSQQEEIANENSSLQQQIDENQSSIDAGESEQDSLVVQLDAINTAVEDARAKILELDTQIAQAEKDIAATQAQMDKESASLRKRLRAIYIAGDSSNIEIVLGAADFSDFIDKLELVKNISDYDNKLIDNLKNSVAQIEQQQASLKNDKAQQQTEQDKLSEDQKQFNSLLVQNKEKLGDLYDKYNVATETIDANNKQLEEIEKQISDYYASKTATEPSSLETTDSPTQPPAQSNETADTSSSSGDSNSSSDSSVQVNPDGYVWPTPGFYNLTSMWNENRGSYNHGAIDIAQGGIDGADVVAAAAGTVVIASQTCTHNYGKDSSCGCGGGYGNWVMIDHGNGKATVYAHMVSINVSQGDYVTQGKTIGYVGSTGDSTGAHLHFETRLNGEKYNPMTEYPNIDITY